MRITSKTTEILYTSLFLSEVLVETPTTFFPTRNIFELKRSLSSLLRVLTVQKCLFGHY